MADLSVLMGNVQLYNVASFANSNTPAKQIPYTMDEFDKVDQGVVTYLQEHQPTSDFTVGDLVDVEVDGVYWSFELETRFEKRGVVVGVSELVTSDFVRGSAELPLTTCWSGKWKNHSGYRERLFIEDKLRHHIPKGSVAMPNFFTRGGRYTVLGKAHLLVPPCVVTTVESMAEPQGRLRHVVCNDEALCMLRDSSGEMFSYLKLQADVPKRVAVVSKQQKSKRTRKSLFAEPDTASEIVSVDSEEGVRAAATSHSLSDIDRSATPNSSGGSSSHDMFDIPSPTFGGASSAVSGNDAGDAACHCGFLAPKSPSADHSDYADLCTHDDDGIDACELTGVDASGGGQGTEHDGDGAEHDGDNRDGHSGGDGGSSQGHGGDEPHGAGGEGECESPTNSPHASFSVGKFSGAACGGFGGSVAPQAVDSTEPKCGETSVVLKGSDADQNNRSSFGVPLGGGFGWLTGGAKEHSVPAAYSSSSPVKQTIRPRAAAFAFGGMAYSRDYSANTSSFGQPFQLSSQFSGTPHGVSGNTCDVTSRTPLGTSSLHTTPLGGSAVGLTVLHSAPPGVPIATLPVSNSPYNSSLHGGFFGSGTHGSGFSSVPLGGSGSALSKDDKCQYTEDEVKMLHRVRKVPKYEQRVLKFAGGSLVAERAAHRWKAKGPAPRTYPYSSPPLKQVNLQTPTKPYSSLFVTTKDTVVNASFVAGGSQAVRSPLPNRHPDLDTVVNASLVAGGSQAVRSLLPNRHPDLDTVVNASLVAAGGSQAVGSPLRNRHPDLDTVVNASLVAGGSQAVRSPLRNRHPDLDFSTLEPSPEKTRLTLERRQLADAGVFKFKVSPKKKGPTWVKHNAAQFALEVKDIGKKAPLQIRFKQDFVSVDQSLLDSCSLAVQDLLRSKKQQKLDQSFSSNDIGELSSVYCNKFVAIVTQHGGRAIVMQAKPEVKSTVEDVKWLIDRQPQPLREALNCFTEAFQTQKFKDQTTIVTGLCMTIRSFQNRFRSNTTDLQNKSKT